MKRLKPAEFVDANHFIDKLPEGYDAPVSERGSSFQPDNANF
ncbi:MAG: hypothetical protein ACLS5G_02155 [Streptococcus sp.]